MNIAVDVGNTRIKVGLFRKEELLDVEYFQSLENLSVLSEKYVNRAQWIFTNVDSKLEKVRELTGGDSFQILTSRTSTPLQLDYATIETLGVDRIAAAVGAYARYPHQNMMIIDYGTCVTYDLLSGEGVFKGGVIAPGMKMRMKSMHDQTLALPDISDEWEKISEDFPGTSTKSCLRHGVLTAMELEAEGFISKAREEMNDLSVMLTGGDYLYFESKIKAPIFADPNLVLKGLNKILTHNKIDD